MKIPAWIIFLGVSTVILFLYVGIDSLLEPTPRSVILPVKPVAAKAEQRIITEQDSVAIPINIEKEVPAKIMPTKSTTQAPAQVRKQVEASHSNYKWMITCPVCLGNRMVRDGVGVDHSCLTANEVIESIHATIYGYEGPPPVVMIRCCYCKARGEVPN